MWIWPCWARLPNYILCLFWHIYLYRVSEFAIRSLSVYGLLSLISRFYWYNVYTWYSSGSGPPAFRPLEFTIEPTDTVVQAGQQALLPCSAKYDGERDPTVYSWKRNDELNTFWSSGPQQTRYPSSRACFYNFFVIKSQVLELSVNRSVPLPGYDCEWDQSPYRVQDVRWHLGLLLYV